MIFRQRGGRPRRPAASSWVAVLWTAASVPFGLRVEPVHGQEEAPWADDEAVQAVLEQRREGLEAMMAGTMSAETERYSSTFVANTPSNSVVPGSVLLELFGSGDISYEHVEQHIEYAGSHGPDMVVIMGEEIVVPGPGLANAGRRVHRRFTDVFRRENGEWRHDLRHANVIEIE